MPLDPSLDELAAQHSMTHKPEQPNPAAPYLAGARAIGGIPLEMLRGFNENLGRMYTGTPEEQGQASGRFILDALGAIAPFGRGAASTLYGGIPWTPKEVSLLKRMIDQGRFDKNLFPGKSARQISAKMEDIASQPVTYVRQPGAPIMAGDQEKFDQLIMMMSKQNMTVSQMAEKLGVSERTLRRYLNEDLQVRMKGQEIWQNPERVKQYKDLLSKGFLPQQIAKRLGIPESTVYGNLHALSKSGHLNYIPEGGARTPSMPSFKNAAGTTIGDPEFEKLVQDFLERNPEYR